MAVPLAPKPAVSTLSLGGRARALTLRLGLLPRAGLVNRDYTSGSVSQHNVQHWNGPSPSSIPSFTPISRLQDPSRPSDRRADARGLASLAYGLRDFGDVPSVAQKNRPNVTDLNTNYQCSTKPSVTSLPPIRKWMSAATRILFEKKNRAQTQSDNGRTPRQVPEHQHNEHATKPTDAGATLDY